MYRSRHLVTPYLKSYYRAATLLARASLNRSRIWCAEQHLPWSGNDRRMRALRDRHRGRRDFIIGKGPSLKIADVQRVAGLLPVDILGHPIDLAPLLTLAPEHQRTVVDDATESLGARYDGRSLGQWSPITCFSFNGNELITTGGGTMLVTDDVPLALRARYLAMQAKDDPMEYISHSVGYSYRLTNVLGCSDGQLELLPEFRARKPEIARRYIAALADLAGSRPCGRRPASRRHGGCSPCRSTRTKCGIDSRGLMRALAQEKVQTRPYGNRCTRVRHSRAPSQGPAR